MKQKIKDMRAGTMFAFSGNVFLKTTEHLCSHQHESDITHMRINAVILPDNQPIWFDPNAEFVLMDTHRYGKIQSNEDQVKIVGICNGCYGEKVIFVDKQSIKVTNTNADFLGKCDHCNNNVWIATRKVHHSNGNTCDAHDVKVAQLTEPPFSKGGRNPPMTGVRPPAPVGSGKI